MAGSGTKRNKEGRGKVRVAGGLRSGSGGPQSQGFSANCYLCVLRVEEKDAVSANLFSSIE